MTQKKIRIIQGGMGIGVSNWKLARNVSLAGQLGVVSGTVLSEIFIRTLNDGDPGGHLIRALKYFPYPEISEWVTATYFKPSGRSATGRYQATPMLTDTLTPTKEQVWITVAAIFCEVFLAKEGHDGHVGINLLEKVQNPPHQISLYAAMLAGVDYVLMGAGIPWQIKPILEGLAAGQVTTYQVDVAKSDGGVAQHAVEFDPTVYGLLPLSNAKQPQFLAIVSSDALARRLKDKVDGFVIEGPRAGGHNAPPRDRTAFNEGGEPEYGQKDAPNLESTRALGLPFWLAGGYNTHEKLEEALSLGAEGIQVGTGFALSEDSGLEPELRQTVRRLAYRGELEVRRDGSASPTGFPINIGLLAGTMADHELYADRKRVCATGFLRQPYETPDGGIGYRCSGEPIEIYVAKGGHEEDAKNRLCLCAGLCAAVNRAQRNKENSGTEFPILTLGKDLDFLREFMVNEDDTYTAEQYVHFLLGE